MGPCYEQKNTQPRLADVYSPVLTPIKSFPKVQNHTELFSSSLLRETLKPSTKIPFLKTYNRQTAKESNQKTAPIKIYKEGKKTKQMQRQTRSRSLLKIKHEATLQMLSNFFHYLITKQAAVPLVWYLLCEASFLWWVDQADRRGSFGCCSRGRKRNWRKRLQRSQTTPAGYFSAI